MADLERMLAESQDCRSRLIVTDGVFSMDGNVCPLPDIKRLADKYDAQIFIDEVMLKRNKYILGVLQVCFSLQIIA